MKASVQFGALTALLIVLALLALGLGPFPLPLSDIIHTLLQGPNAAGSFAHTILWEIRLPHVLGALLIGAALAMSGAAYQGMFINPLVSPEVLGVLAGAGFGAALGLLWSEQFWMVQLLSLGFGLLAVGMAVALAWRVGGEGALIVLVLSGMITGALFSALLSIVKYTADPYDKLPAIVYWLMGSLSQISWHNLAWATPLLLASMLLLLREGRRLNVLTQGDEEAKSLGVSVTRTRLKIILLTTLLASITVMLAGMIAWVGLIVPHLARLMTGADHRRVLPFSALLGGGYLLLVDLLARTFTTVEIPIGILTALIGLPIFAVLLARLGASGWR